MKSMQILEALQQRIIVADGAFGTLLYEKGVPLTVCYDALNLSEPAIVTEIHREYLEAGAEVIETNTFGANRWKLRQYELAEKTKEINQRGAELALACAGDAAWVAGSIGPLGRIEQGTFSDAEKEDIFREQAQGLVSGGVHLIILETFNSLSDLFIALKAVKSIQDIITITQLMFTDSGRTIEGDEALSAFLKLKQAGADIVGANCGIGPSGILRVLKPIATKIDLPVSAFPNAGFPERREDRLIYFASSEYLMSTAVELVRSGVNLIGGCCGIGPDEIRAMKQAVAGLKPVAKQPVDLQTFLELREPQPRQEVILTTSHFKDLLTRKKVLSVELDPPKTLQLDNPLKGAQAVKHAGADVISIAENPLAVVRLSNVTLARIIQREVGIETIVHLTGRDRNLIGMQSELMGMALEGIHNILAVTGDPPSKGKEENVKGVFDLRSFELISLLKRFNEGQNFYGEELKRQTAFTIGAAFNPNVTNIGVQVERMHKKIERGAQFFQTQPIFSREKIDQILEHTTEIATPILLGILPLVSSRNAEFLHNEFPGISIPADVREKMRQAGENGMQQGIEIAWELIEYAYPHFAGIYIMPPFNKYQIAVELIKRVQERFGSVGN
jgi:methionine synthase I (cobalamin-dependent)/5,10-methylenetetrahydrofolate reductase